ncbi:hypothetical protein Clacol_007194 [Clathrus columnatus]|uniref:NADH:flavin oxidoreductase/NADH oxidase N-terminal domain-containing protein n=1 Tax=Clathrus columnatus TaxID=1419009 RepID=A0AAV5AE83_9AGAM|nr:hypothetical protein Clacol_007194 [Clathrus columnatus]
MPSLSDPLQLGELRLRNRNIVGAMIRNRSTGNMPNELNAEYYAQRALGNAGLIITEGTLISQQGTEWENIPGIWNRDQIKAWSNVVQAVHEAGGQIFCQPTAVTDPKELVSLYKNAAQHAKQAGFDGVEVHAGDGYLLHQFLDSTSNHRTDRWGGSIENRARFTLDVVRALIEVWGYDRVGIKLTPCGGLNDVGMPLEETIQTYTYLVQQLDSLPVLYITLVRDVPRLCPRFEDKSRSTPHDVLETYRHHVRRPYLFLNAGISISEAEELLREEKLDAVVFGRLWISHPDLQLRIEYGVPVDVPIDPTTILGRSYVDPRRGYVDYPVVVNLLGNCLSPRT